ncbi:MAG: cyclic nucleotide-binding domain-containing protein, partial [Granulosicoccus sp.]|nr:cyclic nucleotide-binding domain-containing protein [Granulosicoccus sp.]
MNPLSSEARTLRSLKRLPLVGELDEELWASLIPHISFETLETGDTLFSAGNPSRQLYLVMDGELGLHLEHHGLDSDYFLQKRKRGDTAGDFAVLNGGEHLVTAIATRKSRVAAFPHFAFELLFDINPDILAHVYDTAARLSRRVMLAKVYISLFGTIPTETMDQLLEGTRINFLQPGESLFSAGDAAEGLHIVVSGRLTVSTTNEQGEKAHVTEVGANETIGEFALLTESRRSMDVHATRESLVAELDRAHFDAHIMKDPERIASLSRIIVNRQMKQREITAHGR